jgi:hypothetical protein
MQISNASAEVQRVLAPFMHSPVLLRIIHTFANQESASDPDSSFDSWATNPQVCCLPGAKPLVHSWPQPEPDGATCQLVHGVQCVGSSVRMPAFAASPTAGAGETA